MGRVSSVGFAILASCIMAGHALAQDRPTPEQIARFIAVRGPGPEHEVLARLEGEWDAEIRMYPEPGRGGAPMVVKGRASNRLVLGGRFLELRESADMAGTPLEGVMVLGFDRRHGEWTATRMDNSGTYAVHARGRSDAGSSEIVLSGTDEDPILGHTQVYDFVLRLEGPDRFVFTIVFHDAMHTQGKGPFKAIEVISTRSGS